MKIYNIYQKQVKQYSIDGINWINTLEYRPSVLLASGLESCDEYEPPTPLANTISFEFTGDSLTYKINDISFTATTSPFAESLDNLGINDLTSCESSFESTNLTKLLAFPDTSNVTSMYGMFWSCSNLTSLDLSNFDTSNVTDMSQMFTGCLGLTSLDLSNWDMSNVTDISYMFWSCASLQTITMKNCNQATIDKITQALTDAGIVSNVTIITQ